MGEFSLLPEGANQAQSALHRFRAPTGSAAHLELPSVFLHNEGMVSRRQFPYCLSRASSIEVLSRRQSEAGQVGVAGRNDRAVLEYAEYLLGYAKQPEMHNLCMDTMEDGSPPRHPTAQIHPAATEANQGVPAGGYPRDLKPL